MTTLLDPRTKTTITVDPALPVGQRITSIIKQMRENLEAWDAAEAGRIHRVVAEQQTREIFPQRVEE